MLYDRFFIAKGVKVMDIDRLILWGMWFGGLLCGIGLTLAVLVAFKLI